MLRQLESSLVRVRTEDGAIVGLGFFVSDRQILTCAHVVLAALKLRSYPAVAPQEPIQLDFPFQHGAVAQASVLVWAPLLRRGGDLGGDVALLELRDPPPPGYRPVLLRSAAKLFGRSFRAYGFPRGYDQGIFSYGVVRHRLANDWLQVEDTKMTGVPIQPGFSGGPVEELESGSIIGMVAASADERVGFVIPTDVIVSCLGETWKHLVEQTEEADIAHGPSLTIFLSYDDHDGEAFAAQVSAGLAARGFRVFDRASSGVADKHRRAWLDETIAISDWCVVCLTANARTDTSNVRAETAHALLLNKNIIPIIAPGGQNIITLINYECINFVDWDMAFNLLVGHLLSGRRVGFEPSRRDREVAYLGEIAKRYERWVYLYTELSGTLEKTTARRRVSVKPHVVKYLNTLNNVYIQEGYVEDGRVRAVETVNELREVLKGGGIVLVGEPGSGKTTTLQRLAYEFAIEASEDEGAPLPIMIPLGAYRGGGIQAFIDAHFAELPLEDYFPHRVVLFFDGLNEMPRHLVPDFDQWFQTQLEATMVVTCRRLDYATLKALPLRRADVLPLDVLRIRQFIGNYLEDEDRDRLFWALAGKDVQDIWLIWQAVGGTFEEFWSKSTVSEEHPVRNITSLNQDSLYNQMIANMRDKNELPGLLGLVQNPFLLSIAIEVFIGSGQLPQNRGRLLGAFVDLLIEKRGRPAVSEHHPWIEPDIQKRVLAALAYEMQMQNKGTSVDARWVAEIVRREGQDPLTFVYLTQSATILESQLATNEVRFAHQLLQEYFAAYRIVEDMQNSVPALQYWQGEAWAANGWEETVVLAAGMQQGFVRWLLEINPILACRALTEGLPDVGMTAAVRAALIRTMTSGDTPPKVRAEAGRIINRLGDERRGVR